MTDIDELSRVLGRIESDVKHIKDTQNTMNTTMDKMDVRQRNLELKSAAFGGGAGIVMGAFTSFIAFKMRTFIG